MTTATLATGNRTMADVRPPGAASKSWSTGSLRRCSRSLPEKAPATETAERGQPASMRRGGCRQAGTLTGRWRSSPAHVHGKKAEPHQGTLGGPTPSGRTWCGGASATGSALVYSQGAGRAAALVPRGDGTLWQVAAVLGMRWPPGKLRLGAQPPGAQTALWRRLALALTGEWPTALS